MIGYFYQSLIYNNIIRNKVYDITVTQDIKFHLITIVLRDQVGYLI